MFKDSISRYQEAYNRLHNLLRSNEEVCPIVGQFLYIDKCYNMVDANSNCIILYDTVNGLERYITKDMELGIEHLEGLYKDVLHKLT